MSKKNIQASFYNKEPFGDDTIQLVGWSGNHWDNISFFPKNFQIGLVTNGKGIFYANNTSYKITKGQLFLIHPGIVNSGKPDEKMGWTVDSIVFKNEYVYHLLNIKNSIVFKDFVVKDAKLKTLFLELFNLLNQIKVSDKDKSNVSSIAISLIKSKAEIIDNTLTTNYDEAVNRAIVYITQNYKTVFSLDVLAENAFLSKYHLLRIFKIKTGLTPAVYQIQLRLNEARRLMFQNKPLIEIAHELGFTDQAHFTNSFKKYGNGANPSDLLKTAISYNFKE